MNYDVSTVLSLISRIHTQSQDFLQKKMSTDNINDLVTSHGYILYNLSKTDKMNLTELTQKINRDKSTTTALIKKLLSHNLVKLEKDSIDSRKKYIMLTEQGKKYNELTENLSCQLLQTCYKNFSEEEKTKLLELLTKISSNLEL